MLVVPFLLEGAFAQNIATSWAGGDGTEKDPYQIDSIELLLKLGEDSKNGNYHDGEFFILTKDLVHNRYLDIPDEIESFGDIPDGEVWESIDTFNGVLDGGGHSISGILGDAYSMVIGPHSWSEYFIKTLNGTIRNLTMKNSIICSWIGSGSFTSSRMENCINYAVTRFGFSGGAVNEMRGCGNYGRSYSCGLARGPVIRGVNCYNYGDVISKYRHQGENSMTYQDSGAALFYQAYAIVNCLNFGEIKGLKETSGICWKFEDRYGKEQLSNIVNYGKISCKEDSPSAAIAMNVSYNYNTTDHKTRVSDLFSLTGMASQLIVSDKYVVMESPFGFYSEFFMKSDEFFTMLNNNAKALGSECCGWKRGKDGFPILEIIDEEAAGINDLTVADFDDSEYPIVYYNFQGIEIKSPDKGIFIKVQGKKREKVIF